MLRVSNAVGVVGVTGKELAAATEATPRTADRRGAGAAEVLRNLRRIEFGRVTELADDLDHGALAALGRDARGGEEIDALFLVQRANDDLELRIGEDAGRARRGRARAELRRRSPKSRASMAFALIASAAAAVAARSAGCRRRTPPGATNGKSAGLTLGAVPEVPPAPKTLPLPDVGLRRAASRS